MFHRRYEVGDLFQAGTITTFTREWISNQIFLIIDIDDKRERAFKLICQKDGKTLEATAFDINRDMVKLND